MKYFIYTIGMMVVFYFLLFFYSPTYADLSFSKNIFSCNQFSDVDILFLQNLRQILGINSSWCYGLGVGEKLIVNNSYENSLSKVSQHYSIIRKDQITYRVGLNIDFENEPETNDTKRRNFIHCLNTFNRYMSSLAVTSSNEIRIELYIDSSAPKFVISENSERENSKAWGYSTDCEVIIHELGHNLGLVDLYEGESDGYFCRHKGPSDAIMSGGGLRTRRNSYPDIWYCVCDKSKCSESDLKPRNLDEIRKLNFNDQNIGLKKLCPKGSSLKWNAYKNFSGAETATSWLNRYEDKPYFILNPESDLMASPVGKFYPAEIRSIIFPGCIEKNKKYYECAAEAYKSTQCNTSCANFDYK